MIEINEGVHIGVAIVSISIIFPIILSIITFVKGWDPPLHLISFVVLVFGAGIGSLITFDITYYTKTEVIFYPDDVTYLKDEFEIIIKYDDECKRSFKNIKQYKLVEEEKFVIKRYRDYNFLDNQLRSYDRVYFPTDKEYSTEKSIPIEL